MVVLMPSREENSLMLNSYLVQLVNWRQVANAAFFAFLMAGFEGHFEGCVVTWVSAGVPASLQRFAFAFFCFEFGGEPVGVLVGSLVAESFDGCEGVCANGDPFG